MLRDARATNGAGAAVAAHGLVGVEEPATSENSPPLVLGQRGDAGATADGRGGPRAAARARSNSACRRPGRGRSLSARPASRGSASVVRRARLRRVDRLPIGRSPGAGRRGGSSRSPNSARLQHGEFRSASRARTSGDWSPPRPRPPPIAERDRLGRALHALEPEPAQNGSIRGSGSTADPPPSAAGPARASGAAPSSTTSSGALRDEPARRPSGHVRARSYASACAQMSAAEKPSPCGISDLDASFADAC
jgi:hypothetical protein